MSLKACVSVLAGVAAVTTSGCIFYPAKVEYYEARCEAMLRHYELQVEEVGLRDGFCQSGYEAECLTLVLAVSAGSAVVSGSIVVVGNTLYWLERQGKCPVQRLT